MISGGMKPVGIQPSQSVRLFNEETKCFLHLDGLHETKGREYSWFGTEKQSLDMRAQIKERGGPDYEPIPSTQ